MLQNTNSGESGGEGEYVCCSATVKSWLSKTTFHIILPGLTPAAISNPGLCSCIEAADNGSSTSDSRTYIGVSGVPGPNQT